MNNFDFYTPTKILFGKDREQEVGKLLNEYGYKKVLIHYGKESILKSGLYDRIVATLEEEKIEYIAYGGVEPNPKIQFAEECAQICKKEKVDFILAVGGGSVIDSAKAIAVAVKHDTKLWDFYEGKQVIEDVLPVGCVLTIAAAGSEMGPEAVLTNEENQMKRSLGHESMKPVFAILNPENTYTVSKYHTACGIVDIMMHTLERYFTMTKDVDLTDRLSEGLVKSVIEAAKKVMDNPYDYEARATLMWAGTLSHNGLMGTGRDAYFQVHQIEHEISGLYDYVTHGAGIAAIFNAWALYTYKEAIDRFAQYAVRIWGCEMSFENPENTALEGIYKTKEFFKMLGMPISLKELGIENKNDFNELADKCTNRGKRRLDGYKVLDYKEIIEILELAYE